MSIFICTLYMCTQQRENVNAFSCLYTPTESWPAIIDSFHYLLLQTMYRAEEGRVILIKLMPSRRSYMILISVLIRIRLVYKPACAIFEVNT